ncbi:MAG: DNA gyrase subunit A, partial [Firmicutes bacterium]|nr:DNA gyrase subunit A [Bacillota bacterium]
NNIRTNGLNAIALQDDDMLISVKRTNGKDEIFLASNAGQMIRFFETDVRPTGRSTIGVKGMTLPDGAEIIGMSLASEGDSILVVSENGMGKRTSLSEFSVQKRGGKGVLFYKVTDKTGGIVTFRIVSPDQDLLIITSAGIIIRTPVNSINQIGRITSGVKLMSLADDVNIVSVALAQQAESDTSEETQETEE